MKTKIDLNSKSYESQIIKNWEQCITNFCKENNYTYAQQQQCSAALQNFLKFIKQMNKKIEKKTGLKNAIKVSNVLFYTTEKFLIYLITNSYTKLFSESFLELQKESYYSRNKNNVLPKSEFNISDILDI